MFEIHTVRFTSTKQKRKGKKIEKKIKSRFKNFKIIILRTSGTETKCPTRRTSSWDGLCCAVAA